MDYGIDLTVVKDIKKLPGMKPIGDYWIGKGVIYNEQPYPFPCKFAVYDLRRIFVTPMMLKLPTFLKYHNIDWLRQQLMQVKCIENGAVLLHGAAWKKGGVGYLAVGFPNSGKTTRILREMARCSAGDGFCSDENVIIDSSLVMHPVIRRSFVNRWHVNSFHIPLTLFQRLRLRMAEMRSVLPLFEPNIWIDLPCAYSDYYKWEAKSFKLDKLIYLTEGQGKSLLTLTNNEFPFYTNPALQSYSYATGWDLDGMFAKYKELIRRIECFGNGSKEL